MSETILVTGAAGFIGFHLSRRLLSEGRLVVGVDNVNDYYPVSLKEDRLALLQKEPGFTFKRLGIEERDKMAGLFKDHAFNKVVHLAAQAGVRYSIDHPHAYADSNLNGFVNILEGCRHQKVGHLVFASSSSVYGANRVYPYHEEQNVDHPISLYAATKKANELMAHTYSHLYGLPCTGLRFFTVYGPWGRPDMAYFKFTKAILEGRAIDVYNQGDMRRDFTYIDDIVEGVVRALDKPAAPDPGFDKQNPSPATSAAPYRIYNIGNNHPENLLFFIETLEKALGKKAQKNFLPMQPGDVQETAADVAAIGRDLGFVPKTTIEEGLARFVQWYRGYYKV